MCTNPVAQRFIDFLRSLPEIFPGCQVEDIRVEGDCITYKFTPPYTPSWIHLDPITLQLDEQPKNLESTRA